MQGQGKTIDSLPESVNIDQGSVANNTSMNQQTSMDNMLNPVESRLANYTVPPGSSTCVNAVTHESQSFRVWNYGETSSRLNPESPMDDDGIKMEHGWSAPYSARTVVGPRSEERQFDPASILFPSRRIGCSGNQARNGPLFMQGSSSNHTPQNVNLNAGYVGNSGNGGHGIGTGVGPNLYNSGGLETGQTFSAGASSNNAGSSSGSSGLMVEENSGGSGSSLGGWGLSCKRKALEGTSGQSCSAGSSSCFPQAENGVWHAVPTRFDASSSLSLSPPSRNSLSVTPPEQPNPRFGVGMRAVASDGFPSSGISRNSENSLRSFGRRGDPRLQQEPFNLSSTGSTGRSNAASLHPSPSPSTIPVPFNDTLDLRSTATVAANQTDVQNQPHAMHVSTLSRNTPSFPWNGASSSRVGNLSSSFVSGERGAALRDDANFRSIPRHNADHPMFVPSAEMRSMVQDPASWSLATGNSSGGVSSTTQIGSSSSIHPLSPSAWIPYPNPSTQSQQRLSEFAPWSLFPSADSESGGHNVHFPPLSSGPAASSQEAPMSSIINDGAHHQAIRRSAFMMDRQVNDVLGMPRSLQALAADIEGRHRLISEMTFGSKLRCVDIFTPVIAVGTDDYHLRISGVIVRLQKAFLSSSLGVGDAVGFRGWKRGYLCEEEDRRLWMLEKSGIFSVKSFLAALADVLIRQVLNAMRRGENLRIEDFMLFDPFIYHGLAEMHDRHRDMRLDVDNMSYEELLALEERIGDVKTGLTEESVMKLLKQKKYMSTEKETPPDQEPCCVCQEEYADGDDLGTLDCGHDFHTDCIKQWLMQKNLCPICKTTALPS
ncbi:hypothetical protein JRO89_XS02G0072800 [Xanthoceras sorbifolium]|uniref:RING-type E3 ubiquitin transferase n=1 Tax=Xanthoceras sorbifolium TaxID=99658 RepID=A0ABQ8IF33_9ROSI|nr:hypothetical protein JRO89_XS02G0072800 [Xanthoceras sorbifolium]